MIIGENRGALKAAFVRVEVPYLWLCRRTLYCIGSYPPVGGISWPARRKRVGRILRTEVGLRAPIASCDFVVSNVI